MNDIEKMRKRYASLLYKTNVPSKHDAEELYSTLSKGEIPGTYFWSDIDYSDESTANWRAAKHCVRILTILRGYGENKLRDREFVDRIMGAVKFWAQSDLVNPNWWYNEIGVPLDFGNIGIMMYDALNEDERNTLSSLTYNGSYDKLHNPETSPKWDGRFTGANLIWTAGITVRYALLTESVEHLKLGTELAASEITVGKHEGIQKDGSFFQHSRLLYSGGYGRSFAKDIATLAYVLDGTQYQFPKDKLEIFLTHILDGLRYMTVGGYLDWQCIGREYVRPGCVAVCFLKDALKLMKKTADMPRQAEIAEYFDEICGKEKKDCTKYFDTAHFLCHRTNGIYVGSRFISSTLRASEVCNEENILGANLSYGTTTCIMKRGDEYYNIAPLWDYSRIPGTTSHTETDDELAQKTAWQTSRLPNEVSGGTQSGNRAIVYELCQHDGIEGLCADFAFEGGFVCLGAAIKDTSGRDEALVTTIDQRRITGEMFEADFAFYIDGICYMTLDGKDIYDRTPRVHGSWRRNNPQYPDSEEVSEEILTLEIRHEKGKEASYAYLICAEDKEPEVEVIKNDGDVQAILLPDGTVMAVFYKDCELAVGNRLINGKKGIYIENAR